MDKEIKNVEETTVTTTEVTEEEPPVEMKRLCGIEYPASYNIKDEDVEGFYKEIQEMTNLEVVKTYKDFQDDFNKLDSWDESLKSSEETYNSLMETSKQMDEFIKKINESNENVPTSVQVPTTEDDDHIDFDKIRKDLKSYREYVETGLQLISNRYEEMKAQGPTLIIDDILESLDKNVKTLDQSSNVNKDYLINKIDKVIDELKPIYEGNINLSRIYAKLQNPKRIKELVKEAKKCNIYAEFASVGFKKDFYDTFTQFMITENEYTYIVGEENIPENKLRELIQIFAHHLISIIHAETKRGNYLSIIYKVFILRVLEINEMYSDYMTVFDKRFSKDLPDEAKAVSEQRHQIFEEYKKLFKKYDI